MADGKTKGKEKRNDEGHFPHSSREGGERNCVLSRLSWDLFRDLFPERSLLLRTDETSCRLYFPVSLIAIPLPSFALGLGAFAVHSSIRKKNCRALTKAGDTFLIKSRPPTDLILNSDRICLFANVTVESQASNLCSIFGALRSDVMGMTSEVRISYRI